MPVMEGKALLFKEFGGVDAWPICLDTKDADEIVAVVKAIAPGFGGINLEDISAPRCFEIEGRLRAELDIPVFHDDQHGTAIVVLAALLNALQRRRQADRGHQGRDHRRRRGRRRGDATSSSTPASANVIGCDRGGAIYDGRAGLNRDQAGVRGAHEPGRARRARPTRCSRARTSSSASRSRARSRPRGVARDGRRRDRVRDGEPDARDRARGAAARQGRRRRDGALRLSEPDQQRARVPRRLPRRARRPRERRSPRA